MSPLRLGAGLMVVVEVLLDRTVHDVMDSFRAAVQVRPENLACHLGAGGFDYLLKTRVPALAGPRRFDRQCGPPPLPVWTAPAGVHDRFPQGTSRCGLCRA